MLSAGFTLMRPGEHNNKHVILFTTKSEFKPTPHSVYSVYFLMLVNKDKLIGIKWVPGIEYETEHERDEATKILDSLESFIDIIEYDKTIDEIIQHTCNNPFSDYCPIYWKDRCFGCPELKNSEYIIRDPK